MQELTRAALGRVVGGDSTPLPGVSGPCGVQKPQYYWENAHPARPNAKVTEYAMPQEMVTMRDGQRTLSAFEGPRAAADEARRFYDLLSKSFQDDKLAAGAKIDYATWVAARKLGERGRAAVDAAFSDIDVILTAPAPGEAPLGLERTGNATFNLLWTYLWMPCVTLPHTRGPAGLPVGIQLVGRQHEDAALLDMAGWVRGALQ